ncbi:pair-rule protein odd-paired-like protein [Lasius niger]|uniref:Pair-rule protein odd-paired-like protein n=1 Tax=Lasius niger TaxID=67767 RepID=A0A0J7KRQ3_LASNI|nr:pair-rule protein odd-paired-like protein [Lasius niger]
MSSGDIHSTFYTMADRVAPKRPMSVEWQSSGQWQRANQIGCYQKTAAAKTRNHFTDRQNQNQIACATSSSTDKLLDPASQLRELIETVGHLIPDPLLVPRDYLPALAAAPATEIPKLLASRPELRLPEALTRPDLLRDPDLLVISLAHLQHVLDHGEGPVSRSRAQQPQQGPRIVNGIVNKGSSGHTNSSNGARGGGSVASRPKLSCKPIGTLMPAQPIDLSSGASRSRVNPYPPLLRVRSGLLKQEPEVSSTATSPDESQLWHPLFGR